jgi:hypothetical protein
VKYADARAARVPLVTIEIPPSVWAQTWAERPIEPVTVGLRSLAETTLSEVTGAAMTKANRLVPGGDEHSKIWADEYNQGITIFALGRALCRPECADVPWWDYPDLQAPIAFSPAGAAWLYARFAAAMVSASVLASEEDPGALLVALGALAGGVDRLSPARRSQASRHLRAALDILEGG